jgi:hypothetical protein|tara:strand:- start:292 stop:507 length:216 start_codon:yes stop_codon:yes gene_type:complete
MKIEVNSNTVGLVIAVIVQMGALIWWGSKIDTQQQNILQDLEKTERLQNQLTHQQETIFELRYQLGILQNK